MLPALSVHSDFGPLVNDHWEKNLLSSEELKKIQSLLDRIWVLKQQGLNGLRIVSSYLHRRVQPLKAREHYGFKYSGAKDHSRMVLALELTEEEVLEHLKKILKRVSICNTPGVKVTKNVPCHHMHCKAFMIKLTLLCINSNKFIFSMLNVFLWCVTRIQKTLISNVTANT
jgi:hypothetical protein